MPKRLLRREWWTSAVVLSAILFLAGCGVLVYAVIEFSRQQDQTDQLSKRAANLAEANCFNQKAIRSVLTILIEDQVGIDPRAVRVFVDVLSGLPKDCTP